MKEEAHKYPDAEQLDLLEAARTWRLPYWDWALKKPVPGQPDKLDYNVPLVIQSKKVRIRLPTVLGYGDVSNAFYQFTMPSDMTMGDASLKNKDPRKDLRITKSEIQYPPKTGPTYTFPVCLYRQCSRKPLTLSSSTSAKPQADTQKEKASTKIGLMGSKTIQQL